MDDRESPSPAETDRGDTVSDPGLETGESSDWSAEGGAMVEGPATDSQSADPGSPDGGGTRGGDDGLDADPPGQDKPGEDDEGVDQAGNPTDPSRPTG